MGKTNAYVNILFWLCTVSAIILNRFKTLIISHYVLVGPYASSHHSLVFIICINCTCWLCFHLLYFDIVNIQAFYIQICGILIDWCHTATPTPIKSVFLCWNYCFVQVGLNCHLSTHLLREDFISDEH